MTKSSGVIYSVLLKRGFTLCWVNLLMLCVSIVSYAFIINGSPMGYQHLSRGLTQGDPLCPYLFLHAEGLSTLLAHKEVESHLHSVAISQHAPSISHPHFADDSLLYATASTSLSAASWTCCENMRRHRDKKLTSWTCCKIMSAATSWIGMINTLGFQRLWATTKVFVSAISKRDYGRGYRNGRANYSVSRGMNSLSKLLPNQSRYTRCIVSSFRSIFVMILTALLLISSGGASDSKKIHWLTWEKLSSLKKKVGSGFRNLYAFNLSFLAKQGWKSICSSRSIIDRGSRWRIPRGDSQNLGGQMASSSHSFLGFFH